MMWGGVCKHIYLSTFKVKKNLRAFTANMDYLPKYLFHFFYFLIGSKVRYYYNITKSFIVHNFSFMTVKYVWLETFVTKTAFSYFFGHGVHHLFSHIDFSYSFNFVGP